MPHKTAWIDMIEADLKWLQTLSTYKNQIKIVTYTRDKQPDLHLVLYQEPSVFQNQDALKNFNTLKKKHEYYIEIYKQYQILNKKLSKSNTSPKFATLPLVLTPDAQKKELNDIVPQKTKSAETIYIYQKQAYSNLPLKMGLKLLKEDILNQDADSINSIKNFEKLIIEQPEILKIRRKTGTATTIRPDWHSYQITAPHIICLQADPKQCTLKYPQGFRKKIYNVIFSTAKYELLMKKND